MDFFYKIFSYWLLPKNQRKLKVHSILAGLGNGPHVLGNGPHALGNRPYLCTQFMNTG